MIFIAEMHINFQFYEPRILAMTNDLRLLLTLLMIMLSGRQIAFLVEKRLVITLEVQNSRIFKESTFLENVQK